MKILFAINDESIVSNIISRYQKRFKEIITSKSVYFFNALLNELRNERTYDVVVIGEDLEPIADNDYERIDNFILDKMDEISDEASKSSGEDIPIILICSDRRTRNDQILSKLFSMSIYDALVGNDRTIDGVCDLIYKPRGKKEAKIYYNMEKPGEYNPISSVEVSESEIRNIISYFSKIAGNIEKTVKSFEDGLGKQYNAEQLRIIINYLPIPVKEILEKNSLKYQKLISLKNDKKYGNYASKTGIVEKNITGPIISERVLIPTVEKRISPNEIRDNNTFVSNNNQMYNTQRMNSQNMYNQRPNINNQNINNSNMYMNRNMNVQNNQIYTQQNNMINQSQNMKNHNMLNQNIQNSNIGRDIDNSLNNSQNIMQKQADHSRNLNQIRPNPNMNQIPRTLNNNITQNNQHHDNFQNNRNLNTINTNIQNPIMQYNTVQNVNNVGFETQKLESIHEDIVKVFETPVIPEPEEIKFNDVSNADNDKKEFEVIGLASSNLKPLTPVEKTHQIEDEIEEGTVVKRGRGRPKKNVDINENQQENTVKRGRGRPKKNIEQVEEIEEENNQINEEIPVFNNIELEQNVEQVQNINQNQNIVGQISNNEIELPHIEEKYIDEVDEEIPNFNQSINQSINNGINAFDINRNTENLLDQQDDFTDSENGDFQIIQNQNQVQPQIQNHFQPLVEIPVIENKELFEENITNPISEEIDKVENTNEYDTNELLFGNQPKIEEINEPEKLEEEKENAFNFDGDEIFKTNNFAALNKIPDPFDEVLSYNNVDVKENDDELINTAMTYGNDPFKNIKNIEQNIMDFVPTGNAKICSFIGTSKNGVSFIINSVAQMLIQSNIRVAILDETINRNSFYIYTNNDDNLVNKAKNSIKNLEKGYKLGLEVSRYLALYTNIPDGGVEQKEENIEQIIQTLSENYDVILIDTDYETNKKFFKYSDEIYLVQTMDTLTIQPLTKFLNDLKNENILNEAKLKIILNKYVNMRNISAEIIIEGLTRYNEPSMTMQKTLFDSSKVPAILIPFDVQAYQKYMEMLATCQISINGFSNVILNSLDKLANMIYNPKEDGNISSRRNKTNENAINMSDQPFDKNIYSNKMTSILDRMKRTRE